MKFLTRKLIFSAITTGIVLVTIPVSLWAGTTGKITGRVNDKSTGEPLPGASVIIEGTTMGAATDVEGHYFILNVPPGLYSLKVTMMGYKSVVKTEVKVSVDLTTTVDFAMELTVLEGETVTIEAERPMVKRDETAKTQIIEAKTFADLPVKEFTEVVEAQAGFTTDAGGQLHVRGGRSNELAYMIDGVYVRDPYYGGFGSNLDKYTIQELQVMTGAYSAEYGQAMSGVLNIVTKEGGTNYHGRIEFESAMLNDSPYRKRDALTKDKYPTPKDRYFYNPDSSVVNTIPDRILLPGLINGEGYWTGNISGPIPYLKNLTFFVSGRYSNTDSYLPFGYEKRREVNAKLTYNIGHIKANFYAQKNERYYKPYVHTWKYRIDGYENFKNFNWRFGAILTHTISPTTFYKLQVGYFKRLYHRYNPKRGKPVFWDHYDGNPDTVLVEASKFFYWSEADSAYKFLGTEATILDTIYSGQDSLFKVEIDYGKILIFPPGELSWKRGRRDGHEEFYITGDRGRYARNITETWTIRADLTSQVSKNHELKTGFEVLLHKVDRDRWRYPWAGSAHYLERFVRYPYEFAAYIQDKLEYARFVINAGVRLDLMNPKATMWQSIDDPGYVDMQTGEWHPATEYPVKTKYQISPRIGVAYPVTDKTVFHSAYGHFFQTPNFYEMYKHHDVRSGAPLIGNPNIKTQKTVSYEFGVKQQLGSDYVFDVNAYFKDITDLAASTYHTGFPYDYTVFDNSDYARVQGLDITLEKRYGRNIHGILNYTYSVAMGNESNSREGYNNYRGDNFKYRPNREYYLDFDRRHDIGLNLIFNIPEKSGPQIMRFRPLQNISINLLVQAASGLPYTPYVEEAETWELREVKNSARKPWVASVDLRAEKDFRFGGMKIGAFLVVTNLFDRKNVRYVWTRTGKPWDAGPFTSRTQDYQKDPSNVEAPRMISAGIRMTF